MSNERLPYSLGELHTLLEKIRLDQDDILNLPSAFLCLVNEVIELTARTANTIESPKPPKQTHLDELDAMIQHIERLPPQSLYAPINHADFASLLRTLAAILRSS